MIILALGSDVLYLNSMLVGRCEESIIIVLGVATIVC